MIKKRVHKNKKTNWVTLSQLEQIIFRTMRIESPDITRAAARKAAKKVRQSR